MMTKQNKNRTAHILLLNTSKERKIGAYSIGLTVLGKLSCPNKKKIIDINAGNSCL
jgi:hypothetical protein